MKYFSVSVAIALSIISIPIFFFAPQSFKLFLLWPIVAWAFAFADFLLWIDEIFKWKTKIKAEIKKLTEEEVY